MAVISEVSVIKSKRKTISIEVRPDGEVLVRAPIRMSKREIQDFVEKHRDWIIEKVRMQEKRSRECVGTEKLSMEEIQALADKAMEYIPARVRYYAPMVGVSYGRITIRNQRTRWGSCSGKGNLNFNCLLMLAPPEVIDSVVVHELCHRLQMNHSKAFYQEVYRVFPEYDKWNRWLKENGRLIMGRAFP